MSPDKDLLLRASKELNIIPAMIEKDWHVTQVIAVLSKLQYPDFEMIFSGDTALSKAHHLIQRFSEDVDFRIVAPESALNRKSLSKFKLASWNNAAVIAISFPVSDGMLP